jgi:glucosamine--fructose-6-phosphate aminotransferase (isomerizing)
MLKEIHEQPEVISHTLTNYIDLVTRQGVKFARPRHGISPRSIARDDLGVRHGLSRGSRREVLARALCARARSRSMWPRKCATARRRCRNSGVALFISQSGETADTLATLRYCKGPGVQRILSVVNVRTSTMARESDAVLPTLAGPEIGVASTKAFTCQLGDGLRCFALAIGRARGTISPDEGARAHPGS